MKKFSLLMLVVAMFSSAWAITYNPTIDKKCLSLSHDGKTWYKTAEYLCIQGRNLESIRPVAVTLTWELGQLGSDNEVLATWKSNLVSTNGDDSGDHDIYKLSNPENSLYNSGFIVKLNVVNGAKRVTIGKNSYFYR